MEDDGDQRGGPRPPVPSEPGWTVRGRLGEGAEAEVWEVFGPDGVRAALKLPVGGREGLDQEASALRRRRHRHLVAVLGELETDRGTGLLSELLPGGTLTALVRAGGPLPADRMRTAVVPIAQALQSLHEDGILHGDVSPSNILFDVDGRPALADLGTSQVLGGGRRRGGTPGFAAPEVLDPEAGEAVGPAADVHALGAVAWFCLTGRAPGRWADRAPLPLLVPDADPELAQLLESCLDEDPQVRPSAEELAHALYATGPCAPVHLHASADPELALVLPTVRPEAEPRYRRRRPLRARRLLGVRRHARPALVVGAVGAAVLMAGAVAAGTGLVPGPTEDGPDRQGIAEERGTSAEAGSGVDPGKSADPVSGGTSPARPAPASAGKHDEQPGDERGEEASRPDAEVLDAVARRRAAALTRVDPGMVADYAVAGSEAAAADLALLDDLAAAGNRFDGLELSLEAAGAAEAAEPAADGGAGAVAVPVTLTTSGHRLVDGSGRTLEQVAERTDPATLVVERTAAGWRVSSIRPR